jgi:hypothetical protein
VPKSIAFCAKAKVAHGQILLQGDNEIHLQSVVAYVNTTTRRWRKVTVVKFGILQKSKEVRGVFGRDYLKPPTQMFHSTFRSSSLEVKKKAAYE